MAAFFSSKKKDDWFLDAEQREYLNKTLGSSMLDVDFVQIRSLMSRNQN